MGLPPFIKPIFDGGLFCPESFWWDNLAYPVERGQSLDDIHSHLKTAIAQVRKDEKRTEDLLTRHSERDRERIVDA